MAEQVASPLEPLVAALLGGDPRGAASQFADRGTLVVPRRGGEAVFRGRDQIAEALQTVLDGCADLRYTASRRYLTPTQVVEEATLEGRHDGPLAGIPGTGEWVRVGARLAATIDAGQIQRLTVWLDLPALWAQLGVEESAAAAASAAATSVREEARSGVRVIHGVDRRAAAPAPAQPAGPAEPLPRGGGRPPGRVRPVLLALLGLLAAAGILTWVVGAVVLPSSRTSAQSSPTVGPTTPSAATGAVSPSATATRPPASRSLPVIITAPASERPTVQPGLRVVLPTDVLFNTESAELTPTAQQRLDALAAQILAAKVHGTIQVNGYTDNRGSAGHNLRLSRQRADAVAMALQVRLGDLAQEVILRSQGFGERNPVASNGTPEGQAMNRRVTVILPES